jgi:hypothetical protein
MTVTKNDKSLGRYGLFVLRSLSLATDTATSSFRERNLSVSHSSSLLSNRDAKAYELDGCILSSIFYQIVVTFITLNQNDHSRIGTLQLSTQI